MIKFKNNIKYLSNLSPSFKYLFIFVVLVLGIAKLRNVIILGAEKKSESENAFGYNSTF